MTGSPSSIVMLGLGNGTFNGSPSLMVTLGLGVGAGPTTTLIGQWSNVLRYQSPNKRIEYASPNKRLEAK